MNDLQEKAQKFADEHGVDRAYGSYDDLAADPEVDMVYISNLHTQHKVPSHRSLCQVQHADGLFLSTNPSANETGIKASQVTGDRRPMQVKMT